MGDENSLYFEVEETVLEIRGLTKRYGSITAVNNLNLEIPRGTIYGILGPNGSGKTTTLGMCLTTIRPTAGTFSWFGEAPSHQVLKRIGAILEGPLFYPYLSGEQNLKVVAKIKEVPNSRIPEVLEVVGLKERATSPFKTYSLGMKQRLAIAAALLANPEVLILDEPTNGLDPQGIAEIRQLIRQIGEGETTVLLASHLLDEVEKVCDHVAVLKKGSLLYSGEVDKITQNGIQIEMAARDVDGLRDALNAMPALKGLREAEGRFLADFGEDPDPAAINAHLHNQGIHLYFLASRKSRLEEQFLELIRQSES